MRTFLHRVAARRRPRFGCTTIQAAPLAILASAAACEADSEPAPDERSEYVDLYLEDGLEPCAGQMPAFDHFVERIFEAWTGGPPGSFRIGMHVRNHDCKSGAYACNSSHEAWVGQWQEPYRQIAHLMTLDADGRSAPSLDVGAAEALGPVTPLADPLSALRDYDIEHLFATSTRDVHGRLAAEFTRFAIERVGPDSYRDFFRMMGAIADPGPDDYADAYEAASGEPLADAWSGFVAGPRCAYEFWFCDVAVPVSLPYVLGGVDCNDPRTIGFTSPAEAPARFRPVQALRVDVEQPTEVVLRLGHAWAFIGSCGACDEQQPDDVRAGSEGTAWDTSVMLEPGAHVFIVQPSMDAPPTFELRVAE